MGSQAKRAGRSTDSFTYHISDMSANGSLVTETVSTGLVVRLWRNGKFFESSASAMTDDHVSWEDSALCVPCTLYASKTGKQYSDKFYNVSILARQGKRVREVARGEVDMAAFARGAGGADTNGTQLGQVHLEARGETKKGTAKASVVVTWRVRVETGAPNTGDSERDDDALSHPDSTSTLASGPLEKKMSEFDQDLRGFEPSLAPIMSRKTGEEDDDDEPGRVEEEPPIDAAPPIDEEPPAPPSGAPAECADLEPPADTSDAADVTPTIDAGASAVDGAAPVVVDLVDAGALLGETGAAGRLPVVPPAAPPAVSAPPEAPAPAASRRASTEEERPSAAEATRTALKVGWMLKNAVSAPTMLKNWRMRYLVLTPTSILWYKTEDASSPQGQLALAGVGDDASVEVLPEDKEKCLPPRLCVRVGRKDLVLQAESMEEWREAVQTVIDQGRDVPPADPTDVAADDKGETKSPGMCVIA